MPTISQPRSAVIRGRKHAVSPPAVVRRASEFDPWEGAREVVAKLASDHSREDLMAVARLLCEHTYEYSIAVPIAIVRISPPSHNSYPLRRPYFVIVNRESDEVVAEIREVSPIIRLRGRGSDVNFALDALARCFDRIVRENHFIPPHVRTPSNDRIDAILNHMVDWERYEEENPLVQPMWGRIRARRRDGSLRIHWITGPNEARDTEALLPSRDIPSSLGEMEVGRWFYGTARCYPDRVEWIEQPDIVPDPNDPEARRAAWDSIPKVPADQPGCWPMKQS